MPTGIYIRTSEHRQHMREAMKGKNVVSSTKHGGSRTKLYAVWHDMIQRCCNKNHSRYPRYGGRGIKIYIGWASFTVFRGWALEHGYREGLTLDRRDNGGDYEPSNCQWITKGENSSKDKGGKQC